MEGQRILLVEGKDDEHVVKHICGTKDLPTLEIKSHEGVEHLLESFPVQLKANMGGVVGIMLDADTNLAARWDAVRNRLIEAGYTQVPEAPEPRGTILQAPAESYLPKVGVWIMPDNKTKGILEDFLRFLIPAGSRLLAHATSSIAAIPTAEKRFSDVSEPKALIHTWLAWQEEPGRPLGTAITARYLDPDVPQVEEFVSWLSRLYFI